MNAETLRVAVTGGTGYIGSRLLQILRNHHLTEFIPVAIVRPTSNVVALDRILDYPTTDETVIVAEFDNIESLSSAVRGADVVVHLASEMDFYPKDNGVAVRKNLDITKNLVDACIAESQRTERKLRFVLASSTEVFGITTGSPVTEDAPCNPQFEYSRVKVLCEEYVKSKSDLLDTVILRPTGVFGPNENFFFRELMVMAQLGISIVAPSPCNGRIMFTHLDDIVQGIVLALKNPSAVGQTYNICPDEAVTYLDIIKTLNAAFGRCRPLFCVSAGFGKILIRLIAPLMNFGKRRVFLYHPKSIALTTSDRMFSNEKIKRDLGFVPKYEMLSGMEEAVREEIATGRLCRQPISPLICSLVTFVSTAFFVIWRLRKSNE